MTTIVIIYVVLAAIWGALMGVAWEKGREEMQRYAECRKRPASLFGGGENESQNTNQY